VTRHLSVSEAARLLKARPRDISDLFYRRRLRDDLCPIVAGRRLIPEECVEMIAAELRRAGLPCDDGHGRQCRRDAPDGGQPRPATA
jgi:hypothetical protein